MADKPQSAGDDHGLQKLRPDLLIGGEEPSRRPATSLLPPVIRHEFVLALLFAVGVFVLSMALDWFLLRQERWRPLSMSAISNLIFAIIAFVLVLRLIRYSRNQRQQVVQRLEVIDQMNHHIRNALQVISFSVRPSSHNDSEVAEMKQAVERIHWTLREILPKVEPEFAPFEGSGRHKGEGADRAPE